MCGAARGARAGVEGTNPGRAHLRTRSLSGAHSPLQTTLSALHRRQVHPPSCVMAQRLGGIESAAPRGAARTQTQRLSRWASTRPFVACAHTRCARVPLLSRGRTTDGALQRGARAA